MQVVPPERILPLEAMAGGGLQLASRPLGRPCLAAVPTRLHSFAPTPVHPLNPPTTTAGVEPTSRRWCGPVETGAPEQRAVHGRFEAVPVCDGSAARR